VTEQKAKEMDELARHVKPLLGFLVMQGVSEVDAWDILQNAFIKVLNRQSTLPESLEQRRAILFGEVNVQMQAHFTEQTRLLTRLERAHEYAVFMGMTQQRDMSGVLEAREQLEFILPQMSPEQYQVFTEKVLDDLTIREVAERLGMKANTTKTYWLRPLETLKEKLEKIENPRGRGFITMLGISSLLALARNASAMVERLRRLFRAIRHAQVHGLVGMAAAVMVMLSPPNSGASADDASSSSRSATSTNASDAVVQPITVPGSNAPGKSGTAAKPSVPNTRAQSPAAPRQSVTKKPAVKTGPPDYLIAMAMTALRNGQPERTLALLDQYSAADAKAANSGMVKTLRADAQAAIAVR